MDERPEPEPRFEAVFEAVVDAIVLIDAHGNILQLNPAAERMFGFAASEIVGRNVNVLMPAPYREEHDGYLRRYLETGHKRIIGSGREVVGRRFDGSTFPMHLSVAEFAQDGDRNFAGILHDITDLKEAQGAREELIAQLEAKNAELERFTYTVSHDLKSPLITIKGFAGQLERSVEAGNLDRFRRDVARIERASEHMQTLLDDLLALSRVGRVAAPAEDVPLDALVAESVELLSAAIDERDAEIVVHGPLPVVRGDRTRLREVVQNLLENALKFSPGRPHVEVTAVVGDQRVLCTIRDQGIGLAPQYAERIFGLFEQLNADGQGTGVGLALVRRIVEVHGGTVSAQSEGLGTGTAFSFTLPLGQSHPGHQDA